MLRNPICPCCSVGLWRRTFWFFMYGDRMVNASYIREGSLCRRHLGGEWP